MGASSSSQPVYSDSNVSSISNDFVPSRPASLYGKRKTVKIGSVEIRLFWANLFFAFVAVVGQVGQNVSLPLWINSTTGNLSARTMDGFFLLSFSSVSFVVIFGLGALLVKCFSPKDLGESEKRLPHSLVFLIGLCDALTGVLFVFASNGSRMLPHLQAMFLIPTTLLLR